MRCLRLVVAVAVGCGARDPLPTATAPAPAALGFASTPLVAPAEAAASPRWVTATGCQRCHASDARAFRASDGEDLAPNTGWGASMMALAARDPYFLAALTREVWQRPKAQKQLERTCLGCHAPMGVREAEAAGQHLSLSALLKDTSVSATLGRDGVSCLLCHSIIPDRLGHPDSFTGGFAVAPSRVAFGPRVAPIDDAMRQMAHTEGRYGAHISESSMCGSCHTVILAPMRDDGSPAGPTYVEQGTYLEWRNSDFRTEAPSGPTPKSCIDCHMVPKSGRAADGVVLSTRPPNGLPLRDGVRSHTLAGGNAYLLSVIAADPAAVGTQLTAAELRVGADAAVRILRTAAELRVTQVRHDGFRLRAHVTIVNRSGHKLPTGYPFRRVWLRWTLRSATGADLARGGHTDDGAIVDHRGQRLDGEGVIFPHRDLIDGPGQTQVWEAIPVDGSGRRTHVVSDTVGLGKDNRIFPSGWQRDAGVDSGIAARGVYDDDDFVAGSDTVRFELNAPPGSTLDVDLVYQSVPRESLDSYQGVPGRAPIMFVRMAARVVPEPIVLASTSTKL